MTWLRLQMIGQWPFTPKIWTPSMEPAQFSAPAPVIGLLLEKALAPTCSRVGSYDTLMSWKQQRLAFRTGFSALSPNSEMKPEDAL